jgi:hypothetical protein
MNSEARVQVKAQLRQAYLLIKAGKKGEAFELITPILAQQPDNIDAWWLAAHAAPTPRDAVFACQKVLTLKPDHWPAQQMLSEQQRRLALNSLTREVVNDPSLPIALKPAQRERARFRLRYIILPLAALVLLVGGFLVVANLTGMTFGLPIGGLFNADYELTAINAVSSDQLRNTDLMTSSVGMLVVGAQHQYHFTGRARAWLYAMVGFFTLPNASPGTAFQLLDPAGNVLATSSDDMGARGVISCVLPSDGRYTLRLTGTQEKSRGAYRLLLAIAIPPTV